MFYYYSGERCIKEECEKLILPEEGPNRAGEVEVEVFGHVQFEKNSGKLTVPISRQDAIYCYIIKL